jgi:hypothetical protein
MAPLDKIPLGGGTTMKKSDYHKQKTAPPRPAPTSSIKIPKESFEDDRERQLIKDTYEARFYALKNPPTRAEILAQARASGFVPTLAGKPIKG